MSTDTGITRNEWGCLEEPARPLVGTARLVRALTEPYYPPPFTRLHTLYELSIPLEGHRFVRVSGEAVYGQHALTEIYPSDAAGGIDELRPLPGRFAGAIDHVRALKRAGYTATLRCTTTRRSSAAFADVTEVHPWALDLEPCIEDTASVRCASACSDDLAPRARNVELAEQAGPPIVPGPWTNPQRLTHE